MPTPSTTPVTVLPTEKTRRGPVLEILQTLLGEGRQTEVVDLVKKLLSRNTELEQRLAKVLSRTKKNEGVSSRQLELMLQDLVDSGIDQSVELTAADARLKAASEIDAAAPAVRETKEPRRQPRLRRPVPGNLRRVDNPLPVPAAERPCPLCGLERECFDHETTEVIELIPAEVVVRVDRREKLSCRHCDGELVRGPVGDKVVSGGRIGSTLVAEILYDKFWDGLPLHRQKQRFERMGFPVPAATLGDQVTWATELLRPLWNAAMIDVLSALVMHLDATSIAVLDRNLPGRTRLGALWGYVGGETALYLYASTHKKKAQREGELGPEDFLKMRQGYTVADASNTFDASFRREGIIECGCNMHARRYFVKALDAGDLRAGLAIAAFKKIYDIEEKIADLDAEQKTVIRQAESKPVYGELLAWALVRKPHEQPHSKLGEAIQYLDNHQVPLMRFLTDGCIPIDNGAVERLHVRTAMTRKNYLFAGSDVGAENAAIAYTILGSCQLSGVNPKLYLAAVLPILAKKIRLRYVPGLLPASWKLTHQEHCVKPAGTCPPAIS